LFGTENGRGQRQGIVEHIPLGAEFDAAVLLRVEPVAATPQSTAGGSVRTAGLAGRFTRWVGRRAERGVDTGVGQGLVDQPQLVIDEVRVVVHRAIGDFVVV